MTNINSNTLHENMQAKINTGAVPQVNPERDFFIRDTPFNSWFTIGHYLSGGHTINFLCYLLMMRTGQGGTIDINYSITDETTGWYKAEDKVYPVDQLTIDESGEGDSRKLLIRFPEGIFEGNSAWSHIALDLGTGSVDVQTKTYGMPIFNGGSGCFPTNFGIPFNQYSEPHLLTNGTIVMDGKSYDIKDGISWFDRQWDVKQAPEETVSMGQKLAALRDIRWNWSWMDINLDNGETMSLWDMNNITSGENYTWVTLQHEDGTQAVLAAENLSVGMSAPFKSRTGQNYPTKFIVRIPDMDAELKVESVIKDQEIISQNPMLNKYEGASEISGTYKGRDVKGYCYVELFGIWA